MNDLGGAALAAELGTTSAEHLLAASEKNLRAMGRAGSIAVLLPATAYSLKKPYANGRDIVDWGVPVAIATDCNPGSCFCESVPFVFGLSVMKMNMTCLLYTSIGTELVIFIADTGQRSAAMELPMTWPYASVPIGCLLMCVRLLIEMYKLWKGEPLGPQNDNIEEVC